MRHFLNKILKSLSSFSEVCQVKVDNGAHSVIGKLITKMWHLRKKVKNQKKSNTAESGENSGAQQTSRIEKPFKREYILRSSVSRPAPYSRQSPQRMYILLTSDEFRLAGAFTEDTMFF